MKKSLMLALKDLKILSRDKFSLFWVLCFPALFSLFFGAIYSTGSKGPSGMKIAVVDEDQSEFSKLYISRLESYEALDLTSLNRDEAIDQVRTGKQVAAVCIKKGFGDGFEAIFDSNNPRLEVAVDPARRMESGYLQGLLAKAQFEALGEKFIDRDWMRSQVINWRSDVEKADDLTAKQIDIFLINPENRKQNYIKRVVAVAGDTVEIKDGELYINDKRLQRQMLPQSTLDNIRIEVKGEPLEGAVFEEINGNAKYNILLAKPPHDKASPDFAKITVPQHHCFVLGDNRNNSHDSRHFGPVPLSTIKGRADYLYWPAKDWSRFGRLRTN